MSYRIDRCNAFRGKSESFFQASFSADKLAQLSAAWAEMNIGQGCFQVTLASLELILIDL
jgi:hypothetical protein